MKLVIFSLMLGIFGCASIKSQNEKFTGKIEILQPYCGGAKPTPEIANGTKMPYKNAVFYVKSNVNNDKKKETIVLIKTNDKGEFTTKLKTGTYFLIHEDKTLSFEKFVEKYKVEKPNMSYVGEKDAKIAYQQEDAIILVEKNKPIEVIIKSKCFVGLNPVLKYTGPMPQ